MSKIREADIFLSSAKNNLSPSASQVQNEQGHNDPHRSEDEGNEAIDAEAFKEWMNLGFVLG